MRTISKRIISIGLALALMLVLTACGEIKKAENAVDNMFAALKNADIEAAQQYINLDELKQSDEDSSFTDDTELIIRTVFKNLNHRIISSEKVDDSTVVVKTEITATDMKPIMGEFFTKALQYAFSVAFENPQPSKEEQNKKMEELFVECVSKPDLATITNEADITVVKASDNSWRIKSDDAFADALLGGLYVAAEQMSESLGAIE